MGSDKDREIAKKQLKASSYTLLWILGSGLLLVLWSDRSAYQINTNAVLVVMAFGSSIIFVDMISTAYNFGVTSLEDLRGHRST